MRTFRRCLLISSAILIASFLAQSSFAQPQSPQTPFRKSVLDQLAKLTQFPESEWRFHTGDVSNGESASLDDSTWQSVKVGHRWNSGTAWFRRVLEIPRTVNGYDISGSTLRLEISASSDFQNPIIIYVNGSRVAMGESLEPIVIGERVQPGQKIVVAAKVLSPAESNRLNRATIRIEPPSSRVSPALSRDELAANESLVLALLKDKPESEQQLDAAFHAVAFTALERGDQAAFDASLREAHKRLEVFRPQWQNYSIRATGNSHIDMAWLWPWTETVEVARNTFRTALELMNEYPEYTFTQSTAQMSAWMEDKYPLLFREIQRRVAEGRWEIVGGMWVEPDLNMPDGESLVRQLLIGKRYFREKFGKDVRIGWNPDSFGYNWQLPQIYKKSGIDFFVTQKLDWNDTNKPKHRLFWWESPDGSRVLTYLPHDYVNSMSPTKMARDFSDIISRTKGMTEMMHLYGIGDHGGGPTRAMFDEGHRWQAADRVYPRVFYGTALGFFEGLEKQAGQLNLPVWKSELYFEYHRGVLTSQAETKKGNRRCEALLLDAEKFSSIAFLSGHAYPQNKLNDAWRKVLFNQFHDVASGTGVPPVARDAARDYEVVRLSGNEILNGAISSLAAEAKTDGPGVAVMVFNPSSWPRSEVVEANVQFPHATREVAVRDAMGQVLLSEVVEGDAAKNRLRVRFLVRDVPSVGYAVVHVVPVQIAKNPASPLKVNAPEMELENEFLRMKVDSKTGCITSLVEKKSGVETVAAGGCGNLLQAFMDKPKDWDAWNIDSNFEDVKWDLKDAKEVRILENTSLHAVVRVVRTFQKSTFTQDLTVYAGVPRVDVKTRVEWNEKHILIKAAFPVAAKSDVATFEIPYGSIERPTTRRTPEEKAQYEVPALRWADLSDSKGGLSLLNNSKYGYDAKENVLRLSLLRAPEWPDPHADEGVHEFTYSFFPHAGSWKDAGTVRRAYELNDPLRAMQVESHDGARAAEFSFLRTTPENIVVTAIKKAEDENALIIRFYEWAGKQTNVELQLPATLLEATEVNLMEKNPSELKIQGGRFLIPTRPFEIKTVKVAFRGETKNQ